MWCTLGILCVSSLRNPHGFSGPPAVAVQVFWNCLQELNESCLDMSDFASIGCYYWYCRSGGVTVRRTFCNVTMLSQMLPKTLSTHQVSEPGDFVTVFLMFWSDVPLMVDQHCPFSWGAIEFESKWFSPLFCQQKMAYIFGRLHIFPYGGSTPSSKWSLCEGFHPQIANVTENVWIAGLEVGSWKTWTKLPEWRIPVWRCVLHAQPALSHYSAVTVRAVCRDSMKAALAGSLLCIPCGVTHGSSEGV